jgi:histidine triad (HIT) family protein
VIDSKSEQCIFCKIARGEIPAARIIDEDDVVAFRDLNPQAPTHILLIPRRHIESVDGLADGDATILGRLFVAARDVARQEGLAEGGYRIVTNVGPDGGQSVGHLHLHLLGGRQMGWPPG